jgi:hypothetical protein
MQPVTPVIPIAVQTLASVVSSPPAGSSIAPLPTAAGSARNPAPDKTTPIRDIGVNLVDITAERPLLIALKTEGFNAGHTSSGNHESDTPNAGHTSSGDHKSGRFNDRPPVR